MFPLARFPRNKCHLQHHATDIIVLTVATLGGATQIGSFLLVKDSHVSLSLTFSRINFAMYTSPMKQPYKSSFTGSIATINALACYYNGKNYSCKKINNTGNIIIRPNMTYIHFGEPFVKSIEVINMSMNSLS
jgi:hypothetical protein